MFVDFNNKVVVSKSFKTAGSSLYNLLRENSNGETVKVFDYHFPIKRIAADLNIDLSDFTKVGLIRNPWDYLVSAYYWALHNRECPASYTFNDFVFKPSAFNWIKQLEYWQLSDLDDVIRFERFEQDVKSFCSRWGYTYYPLQKLKSGIRPKDKEYQSLHTVETVELVRETFYDFIEHYGYEY